MTMIIGVRLNDRINTSYEFQKILTDYGCIIKTRLGLHETSVDKCNSYGLIILELIENDVTKDFMSKLKSISDIKIRTMEI